MSEKYGFGGGIDLPKQEPAKPRIPVDQAALKKAVNAGNALGFVDRDPVVRRKPGPKRIEPQDKVSIPGPKRVIDQYRTFCANQDLTLWQGLEMLLVGQNDRGN